MLLDLLEDGIRFDPHYLPSMNSDHLPMTLCALAGLGAGDGQLLAFRDEYAPRLRPVEPGTDPDDWRAGVGRLDAYASLLRHYRAEIERSGRDAVVASHLPVFLPGIALDAFHPVIRLAYGVRFGSDAETAAALAYMAAVHQEFPLDGTRIDLANTLRDQAAAPNVSFSSSRFGSSICELRDAGSWPAGQASLDACAAASLEVYRATRNFFALHMVTASQAIRALAHLVPRDVAEQALTGSLLAAHLVVGSPSLDGVKPVPPAMDHEHNYKYAFACLSEFQATGRDVYFSEVREMVAAGIVEPFTLEGFQT